MYVLRISPQTVLSYEFFHIIIGRMPQDLFCLIELYDSSVLYKADLVCTFDSLIHIMGDKYNSFLVFLLQLDDLVLQFFSCKWVQR